MGFQSDRLQETNFSSKMMKIETHIRELSKGSVGIVVGYDRSYGGYIGKLAARGLTPETIFVVISPISAQGYVEIMLSEKIIQLSKPEADALCVEEVLEDS